MVDKYTIERGVDQDVRKQITSYLDGIDDRLIIIEDYLGNTPSSGGIVIRMRFNASTAGGDPGSGYIAVDNTDVTLVTKLYISRNNETGNDITTLLQALENEAVIGIFEVLAPNATAYFQIGGAGVQNIAHYEFDVIDYSSAAVLPQDQAGVDMYLIQSSNRLLPPGGDTHWILRKIDGTDYNVEWVDGTLMYTPIEHYTDYTNPHNVAHDQLLGVGPDDHHNQRHDLYGDDHIDVDPLTPLEIRHVLAWNGTKFNPQYRMNWRGQWGPQQYEIGDTAVDGAYLGVANQQTSERLAPQPLGSPAWTLPDVPVWTQYENTSVIYSGHAYLFNETLEIRGLRVWVPELSENTNYRFVLVANPNTNPTYTTIEEPVLNENDWTILTLNTTLVTAGTELVVYIDALNSSGEQTWAYNWIRTVNDNINGPTSGNWNKNTQDSLLRINHFDAEAIPVDHQLELRVVAGTTFEISEVGNPQNFIHFRTEGAYVEQIGYTEYPVSVIDEGLGRPSVGAPSQIRAVQPIPNPTKFVGITNYWGANQPVWGNISSFLRLDGVDPGVPADNAYGIDLIVQRLSISEHWDIAAISGGGGSGGGGEGEPFPEPVDDGQVYGRSTGIWEPVYRKTEAAPIVHTHVEADITDLDKYTQAEVDASQAAQDLRLDGFDTHVADMNNPHGVTPGQIGASPVGHGHEEFAGGNSTGFVPNPLTAQSRFLRDDGTWQDVNTLPSGGVSTKYFFNSQTAAIPGVGEISVNNADQTLATAILANDINQEGNDLSAWLSNLIEGDYLGLNVVGGAGESVWYRVSGPVIEQLAGWEIPVNYQSGDGGIPNLAEVDLIIAGNPASRVPPGGAPGQHLAKQTGDNYDTYWVDPASGASYLYLNTGGTAVPGGQYAADTSGGTYTVLLPPSPQVNDTVALIDPKGTWATNNVTAGRNGETIDGLAEDMILDLDWGQCLFIYDGAGWLINPDGIGTEGAQGPQGIQGQQGDTGPSGADGADGADGVGVAPGGNVGDYLIKSTAVDYQTEWFDPPWDISGNNILSARSGYVGINLTPRFRLHAHGAIDNSTAELGMTPETSIQISNGAATSLDQKAEIVFSPAGSRYAQPSVSVAALYDDYDGSTGNGWHGGAWVVGTRQNGTEFIQERMRIDNTGKMAIAQPIVDTVYDSKPNLSVEGNFAIQNWNNNNGSPTLYATKSKGGSPDAHGAVAEGNRLFFFAATGSDGASFNHESALMLMECDGAVATNSVPGRIVFSTTGVGERWATEKMRIDSAGDMGLGTSDPQDPIHIYRDSNAYLRCEDATGTYLFVGKQGNSESLIYNSGAQPIKFGINNSEAMRIQSNGRVGINYNLPDYTLDVKTISGAYSPAINVRSVTGVGGAWARLDFSPRNASDTAWVVGHGFIFNNATDFHMRTDQPGARLGLNANNATAKIVFYTQNLTRMEILGDGGIKMVLPTSPGATGTLWNDNGTVKIA